MNDVEHRLAKIEARNKQVEDDKAWELSPVRRAFIAFLTYLIAGLYLSWLSVEKPWLNAIVPVLGFILSTAVLSKVKAVWLNQRKR